jgi:hypothetical protein
MGGEAEDVVEAIDGGREGRKDDPRAADTGSR